MKDLDKLSAKEKLVYQSLVNPDDPRAKQYKFDMRYQQEILSMLLMDKVFLIQSMQLIKPKYFVDKAHEEICSILFTHFNHYKQMPAKFVIANEIGERFINDDKKILLYTGELEALTNSYIPGLESREHCLNKITEFAREQSLRLAVAQTLDLLEKNPQDKWVKIEEMFRQALLIDHSFDMGLDYFDTLEDRYDRMSKMDKNKEVFITGFDAIDNPAKGLASGGIGRGEIAAFIGLAGSGKSMLLVKSAVQNIIRNKKVLYISLEMDQDKIARRFDAQLAVSDVRELIDNRDTVIKSLKELVQDDLDKRKLVIKQFAAGTADMHTIRAYCAQLNLYGFKPDMLCVDYVGEFKDDPEVKTYESRQRIVRDLRGFGVESGHATFTALQSNRLGREAQDNGFIDDSNAGDSYGQMRPLDACWSINQRVEEKSANVGRIFVVKHRDGRSRYYFPIKQDSKTLDIREISFDTYNDDMSKVSTKKAVGTDGAIDNVIGKKNFKQNEG